MTYNSIRPGQVWLDTSGNRIQAHGGSIFFENDTFYWYGENKEKTLPGNGIWHWGVRAYSSKDLYNWKDEGLILPPDETHEESPVHPSKSMDRPHILYNKVTKKYVMWIKIMNKLYPHDHRSSQFMVVATADRFLGPYTIERSFHPLGMNSGDFDLVQHETDGKAYIYFERVHTELVCADLTEDYLGVSGYYSSHFPRLYPPYVREAPAFFARKGRYYLITSGTTGYFPNPSEAAESQLYHGPWTLLGDPHLNDRSKTSFCSQISSVFKHPHKKDLYITLGDRWLTDLPGFGGFGIAMDDNGKPGEIMPDMCEVFRHQFDPELTRLMSREETDALSARNTSLAGYVWLPIRFSADGRPLIEWRNEWKIEDFENL